MKHWLRIVICGLCVSAVTAGNAQAGTTAINESINAGALSLTNPATATLPATTLSVVAQQTSTGTLGSVVAADNRGTGAGWAVTMTATNFARIASPVKVVGSNALGINAGYFGTTAGTYTVTIQTGGALGTALFTVSGLETQAATYASSMALVGTKGLSLNFPSGTYAAGDQWTISVDTIPVSGLTITPSTLTTLNNADPLGVSSGASHTFLDSNDPTTLMQASANRGMGAYSNNPTLSLIIPPGAKAGNYTSIITETIN